MTTEPFKIFRIQPLRLKADDQWLDGLYDSYDKMIEAAPAVAQTLPVGTFLTGWWVYDDTPDKARTTSPSAGWTIIQTPNGVGTWLKPQHLVSIRQQR